MCVTQVESIDVSTRSLESYIGTEHAILHDGLIRWFVEHPTPPGITTNPPLLIILHFSTGNMHSSWGFARVVEKDPWLRLCYQYGFLAIAPNAVARRRKGRPGYNTKSLFADWNDLQGGQNMTVANVDDVGFISAIVDWAFKNRSVDPNRVYITGISNGGMMTLRMVIERPNMFAGAAAMIAPLPDRYIPFPSKGTPILLLVGTEDRTLPFNGGKTSGPRGFVRSADATRVYFVTANNAGPDAIETVLPDRVTTDNCTIVSRYYPHNTTPVLYYVMQGGGHLPAGIPTIGSSVRLPKYLTNLLEERLGNLCDDAESSLLGWEFMTNFTLTSRL
jgi:polyhydroxybutyrate depolymerase